MPFFVGGIIAFILFVHSNTRASVKTVTKPMEPVRLASKLAHLVVYGICASIKLAAKVFVLTITRPLLTQGTQVGGGLIEYHITLYANISNCGLAASRHDDSYWELLKPYSQWAAGGERGRVAHDTDTRTVAW